MLQLILEKKDKFFIETDQGLIEIELLKPGINTGRVQVGVKAPPEIKVLRNIDKPGFLTEKEIKAKQRG